MESKNITDITDIKIEEEKDTDKKIEEEKEKEKMNASGLVSAKYYIKHSETGRYMERT